MKKQLELGMHARRLAFGLALVMPVMAGAQTLEEIVVTAERRETSLQRTPISIVAFTAESMEFKGIETLEDVASFTPNLDIKGSRGTGNVSPTYQIRGLSGGGGATGERAVGMYIDGVYMPRTTGPFMNVLDVERIEVLRGPQGTLFGRNSTGGAIRVFTKQPTAEREGYLELGAGNYGRADLNAMINVPLSDQVFLRAQAASLNQDGYVTRGTQKLGGSEDTMLRLQLAIEPSDKLRVGFSLSSSETNSDGNPQDLATFDMLPNLNFEGGQADWISDWLEASGQPRIDGAAALPGDPRIVLDDYTMPDWCFIDDIDPDWDAACNQFNDSKIDQFDAKVDWDLSDNMTLSSITGISSFDSEGVTDWVMLGQELRPNNVESDVVYQELQLAGSFGNDRVDYVVGFSYFQEDSMSDGVRLERTGTSSFPADPGTPPNSFVPGTGPGGTRRLDNTTTWQDSESLGLFANLGWHVTDAFTITPGVRFSDDTKSAVVTRTNTDEWTWQGTGDSATMNASTTSDETDYRLTLDYTISENHMVYVTSSQSFRAGAGVTLPMGGIPNTPAAVDELQAQWNVAPPFTLPESVTNNEIGFRTEWGDGRARINLTYYDMVYGDRQAAVAVPDLTSPTGFVIQVVNSGDVNLDGFELDGQVVLTDNLSLDFSAGTVNYEVEDVCGNNGKYLFPGPVEDSYTIGLRGDNLMSSGKRLSWSLSYAYVGEQETHPGSAGMAELGCLGVVRFTDSAYRAPDYALLNGRISLTNDDGKWAVTLFGNNLTDENYATYASRFGGGFWEASPVAVGLRAPDRSALGRTMGRPRELGVQFKYNFGEAANRAR
jgi:iron complex outermembrane receptor protein